MGRGGSNPPSDTTELPPSRSQTSLFECHVEPWSAFDGHLQVVGIHGDGVQQLLHEHPPLGVGRLFPQPAHVHLVKDPSNLLEPRRDV
jgi:hypothetical protein